MSSARRRAAEYESVYRDFGSDVMHRLRAEAYGEDIGQHSWASAEELREDSHRLGLGPGRRLLDLGCGACGPLSFLVTHSGCCGTGLELSASAVEEGRARAEALGVGARCTVRCADLNAPLPRDLGLFEAVLAIDVVLHLSDRESLFRQIASLLAPGGGFLFTDAGVITGPLSEGEMRRRAFYGYTDLVPDGWNEARLASAGLRLLERVDRTASVLRNVRGRIRALRKFEHELRTRHGSEALERHLEYLGTVEATAMRGALSRFMYFAVAMDV